MAKLQCDMGFYYFKSDNYKNNILLNSVIQTHMFVCI
jgi:hypothetical protein